MKTQITAIKTRKSATVDDKVEVQIARVGFAVVGITSCVIGLWSAACLVSGMVASGGPVGLVVNWFKAVTG